MFFKFHKNFIINVWRKTVNTKKKNTQTNFYKKANALRLDNLYKEAVANYLNAILIDRNNAKSYYE